MEKKKQKAQKTRPQPSAEPAQLYRPTEEVKAWAGMLGAELASWPGVRSKPMFGLVAFYRGKKIFAALPRTRALNSPHSILFKFHTVSAAVRRARKKLQPHPAGGWASFELHSPEDLGQALDWLDLAYRVAR
jgi:hypothetical protein